MKNLIVFLPWRRLIKVGSPYWVSGAKRSGLLYLMAIFAFLILNAGVSVFINKTVGNFMTSVEQRLIPSFYFYLFCWLGAIALASPIQVAYAYFRTRLALEWRNWLSRYLIERYLKRYVFEGINRNPDIDNPEQRLTQDADSFCNSAVGLFMSIVDACVNVLTFIVVLYVISLSLSVTVMVYSTLGLLVVAMIGKNLVNHNYRLMKSEADLRAGLTRAREADSIPDSNTVGSNIDSVIATLKDILSVNCRIQLFTAVFNPLVTLIPVLIIAPHYFAGGVPFGTISQAVHAFNAVFAGATVIISQFAGISSFAAITNRLGALVEAIDECDDKPALCETRSRAQEGYPVSLQEERAQGGSNGSPSAHICRNRL